MPHIGLRREPRGGFEVPDSIICPPELQKCATAAIQQGRAVHALHSFIGDTFIDRTHDCLGVFVGEFVAQFAQNLALAGIEPGIWRVDGFGRPVQLAGYQRRPEFSVQCTPSSKGVEERAKGGGALVVELAGLRDPFAGIFDESRQPHRIGRQRRTKHIQHPNRRFAALAVCAERREPEVARDRNQRLVSIRELVGDLPKLAGALGLPAPLPPP